MAESDVFERRLRAALVRHTDGGPTDFDALSFARLVAEKEPRRRGLGAVLRWRRAGVPRAAWVLLLIGLLAALALGTLAVGSQLQRKAPAVVPPLLPAYVCPPGSTPDEPGPVDQARPVGSKNMAFDRRAGRLVVVAVGVTELVETWTFDVCTNTWSRMHPNREPPDFAWRPLVYDVDSALTVGVAYGPDGAPPGRVWAYDLAADTWTEKAAPTDRTLRAYDPLTGLIVATKDFAERPGQQELWTYAVETDTWTLIDRPTGPAWHAGLAYDASVDRFIAYAGSETWLFDIRTGAWSRAGARTPVVEPNWAVPTITYDESAERTVVAGSAGMAAYDAAADRWEVVALPGGSYPDPTVYDPVNGRLVGFGWEGDAVAFDLVTREWTVLLEQRDE